MKTITIMKFIHGWLANGMREYYRGTKSNSLCPLCGLTDDRKHIFTCQHSQVAQIRDQRLQQLINGICHSTEPGFQQVFVSGLKTVFGHEGPTYDTVQDWPRDLRDAYSAQQNIGWEHVFYGRLANHWETLSTDAYTNPDSSAYKWTGKAIRMGWEFSMDIWTLRNQIIHGNNSGPSQVELRKTTNLVSIIHNAMLVARFGGHSGLCMTESTINQMSHESKIAWLSQVKMLYPEEYRTIVANANESVVRMSESEYTRFPGIGTSLNLDDI